MDKYSINSIIVFHIEFYDLSLTAPVLCVRVFCLYMTVRVCMCVNSRAHAYLCVRVCVRACVRV